MDMRSHEMIERRRDDNGTNNNNGTTTAHLLVSANDDNCNGNNNNNTRVSCNSQTLDHGHLQSKSSPPFSAAAAKPPIRYRECLKNHAANVGGSVHDGCGEFMPSGEEGTIEALRCAACDCHRNFHRKEIDGVGGASSDAISHHHHRHHHHSYGGGGRRPPPPNMMLNPLMLPPPPNYTPMHHHKYGMSPTGGGGGMVTPMSVAYGGGAESSSEDLNLYGQSSGEHGGGGMTGGQMGFSMSSKKRFRTKFTAEQKERMMEFADKLGWRMNKQDEEELKRFCNEIGVKRQVFKVWMHNNKNNAKKPLSLPPPPSSTPTATTTNL